MSKTLDEIRKKLQSLENKASPTGPADKTTYAHWNIAEGTSAVLRFLPDGNEENTFFWTERQQIKLPFAGVKGHDERKQVFVNVPCLEMWEGKNSCPILNEVRPWWRDESLKDLASKYWVKRTYYAQGFVKQDPMNETDPPENPIRKFIIGPQIFAIIKAALMDPDMENTPVHFINGTDFTVSKTSKGGYADYGTSKWARKESSLSEEMLGAIEQYGLVDLASYLPKRPTSEQVAAMFEMFQESVNGELYDPEKWGKFYKPYGFDSTNDDADAGDTKKSFKAVQPSRTVLEAMATVKVETPQAEESAKVSTNDRQSDPEPAASSSGKSPQEILRMLRERKTA